MAEDRLSITVTGSGGAGVVTVGNILLGAAALTGWYARMVRSSGPQIRGGEVASIVCLSAQPIQSESAHCDLLLALDWKNIDRFSDEMLLTRHSMVVSDPAQGQVPASIRSSSARCVEVPFKKLATTVSGGRTNMVALGVAAQLARIPHKYIQLELEKIFQGDHRFSAGMEGVDAGFAAAPPGNGLELPEAPTVLGAGRWSITGNEAAALGALRAGVRIAAGYPITPATEILEWLASALPKIGGTF
ncbi:MAG: 2-oxoacid:acceptor oxidoreductase family protein, partial [Arenicellales bacterium]|nr:2-oxoacid:acceptor oxidoreductase family protein [Arenicellales bacterium]